MSLFDRLCFCSPPPAVTGITAAGGGGSGEVVVTWDPLPDVAFYRVYQRRTDATYWQLGIVTPAALGNVAPGRIGVVDAADYFPWPLNWNADPRHYVVSAVGRNGMEGPLSAEVAGSPP